MKQVFGVTILLVVVAVILLPWVVVRGLNVAVSPPASRSKVYKGEDLIIKVYLHDQDKIVQMNLEDYVKGVVAAEMPAEFELEALKAQAVAARTYAVKNMVLFGGGGVASHPGADVSTDLKEGQAWASEAALRERWGSLDYARYWQKISEAVEGTRGLIVTYNGEPINAVFHSTSGERTASAKEVWGFDYPYLQSVPDPWDKSSPRYSEKKEYSYRELEERLGPDAGVMTALQNGDNTIARIIDRTGSGRVDKIRIGSKTFSALVLREKLGLRSTNFTVEVKNDKLVFDTIGYGHGVGLCQYGANGMAKEGKDFRQILTYYYTGVAIKNILES